MKNLKELFIGHFDGSSIPNPGEMSIGGKITNEENFTICTYSKAL